MTARLIESREIAPEVRHFVFDASEPLDFRAGQFLSFVSEISGKPITRAYSVAAPCSGHRFELCLNRVREGKFSPYLFALHPGAEIQVKGPYGAFVLREPHSDSVMIATGTGIAPFRAILQETLPEDRERQYKLIFGVRHEYALLYRAEFEQMERDHLNFRFWPTLSRPETSWTGRTGHVQNHLTEAIGDRRDIDVYICGLKAMVDDVRRILKEQGFDRKRIIYEKYD